MGLLLYNKRKLRTWKGLVKDVLIQTIVHSSVGWKRKLKKSPKLIFVETSNSYFLCILVQGRRQPTQSQLIQIYSVYWTDVYDTHNIEHRTESLSH